MDEPELYTIGVPEHVKKLDRRRYNKPKVNLLEACPRDPKTGQMLPKEPGAEAGEPLGSGEQMLAEIFESLGGWRKACRMYGRGIKDKKLSVNKRIDALNDLFRFAMKDVGKNLSDKDMDDLDEAELAAMAKAIKKFSA